MKPAPRRLYYMVIAGTAIADPGDSHASASLWHG